MSDRVSQIMMEADKLMLPRSSIVSFFGGSSNQQRAEEAAELYKKAANLHKVNKEWDLAGKVFLKAAEAHTQAGIKYEVASDYISAAGAFKKSNIPEAVKCMKKAVEYYTEEGRFSIAARHQKEIAEIYENEMDLEAALEAYQIAGDFYEGEGATSSANQCLQKVAQFSASLENYERAIEIYEKIAKDAAGNKLLIYGRKNHFLHAGICRLCTGDTISANKAIERYQETDYTFSNTRECKFLIAITEAYSEFDVEAFTNAVVEFDSLSKLSNWLTTLLLRIKKKIKEEDECLT